MGLFQKDNIWCSSLFYFKNVRNYILDLYAFFFCFNILANILLQNVTKFVLQQFVQNCSRKVYPVYPVTLNPYAKPVVTFVTFEFFS